jgi:hypothetical protein
VPGRLRALRGHQRVRLHALLHVAGAQPRAGMTRRDRDCPCSRQISPAVSR